MYESIDSVIKLYFTTLKYESSTYNKRVGIFNNLIETFLKKISNDSKNIIFEYNMKFGVGLLTESITNNKSINPNMITEWIIKKIDNGELILKEKFKDNNVQFNLNEQYAQSNLDDKAYYYTRQGKLVQGKKNAPDGVEAKYIYPDLYNGKPTDPLAVPKDPKGLPSQIPTGYVDQGFQNKQYYDNQKSSQDFSKQTAIAATSKTAYISKNVKPLCKKTKESYVAYNIPANALSQGSKAQNGLKFLCHDNYCNSNRSQIKDPEGYKCVNNTVIAKIKEAGWEGFFEGLREVLTSVVGAAAQVAIDMLGGGVGVQVAWAILLGWDLTRPQKDVLNILIDVVGILSAGMASKGFSIAVEETLATMKLAKPVAYDVAVSIFKKSEKLMSFVENILPTVEKVAEWVGKVAKWVANKIGPEGNFIAEGITKFQGWLSSLSDNILGAASKKAATEYAGEKVSDVVASNFSQGAANIRTGVEKSSELGSAVATGAKILAQK